MNGHEYRLMSTQNAQSKWQLSDNPKQGIYIQPLKLRKTVEEVAEILELGFLEWEAVKSHSSDSAEPLYLHWAHRRQDLSITSHGPDRGSLPNFGFCRLERRDVTVFSYVPVDESTRLYQIAPNPCSLQMFLVRFNESQIKMNRYECDKELFREERVWRSVVERTEWRNSGQPAVCTSEICKEQISLTEMFS